MITVEFGSGNDPCQSNHLGDLNSVLFGSRCHPENACKCGDGLLRVRWHARVAVVQLSVLLGGTKCLTVAWLSSSSVSCVTNSGTGAKLAVQARVALTVVQTFARAGTCSSVTAAIDRLEPPV